MSILMLLRGASFLLLLTGETNVVFQLYMTPSGRAFAQG